MAKRDYRTELSGTGDLSHLPSAPAGCGCRTRVYGVVPLAARDAGADMFHAVTRWGPGFSDAGLLCVSHHHPRGFRTRIDGRSLSTRARVPATAIRFRTVIASPMRQTFR